MVNINECPDEQKCIKKIQDVELHIFKELEKIFKKYNLRYYAIGGTCLGAVRHQGFIPWDDDIDIVMPGEDYEKFKSILSKELPSTLSSLEYRNNKRCSFLFLKIFDNRTTFVEEENLKFPEIYSGVFVDIMPFYGLPKDQIEREKHMKKLKNYMRCNYFIRQPIGVGKNILERMYSIFMKVLGIVIPFYYFSDKYDKLLAKYYFDESEYVSFTWSARMEKLVFPKRYFENYVMLPFEGGNIRCPSGWHGYLEGHYGDYKTIPPIEEQKSPHNRAIIDLNKSYKYYQKRIIKFKN